MKQFYKYLASGPNDLDWGLYLNTAGSMEIPPQTEYPLKDHPSGYYFTWEQGRVLQEYQLNYITRGSGVFEDKNGVHQLKRGSLLIIFPGEWHRYRPVFQTGWRENYIGFSGEVAEIFMRNKFFQSDQPVMQVGEREEILDSFLKIFDLVEKEQPGFQQVVSGLIVQLLGYLVALDRQKGFSGKRIASIVEEARFRMRNAVGENFDIERFAEEQNIGYSYFRRMFKNYTGLSPRQYCLQLKMMRARELLLSTNLSVKEISYELGFESIHYFSRMFRQKTGKSPTEFRS